LRRVAVAAPALAAALRAQQVAGGVVVVILFSLPGFSLYQPPQGVVGVAGAVAGGLF
jgi:hypothetical protein